MGTPTTSWRIHRRFPGENVFQVIVHNAAGNVVDNRTFSLLAF